MRTKSMILISMSLSTAVLRGFTTLTSRFTSYLSRITKKQKLANNVKWTSQEPYQLLLGTYVSCTRSDTYTRWKTLVTVKSTAIHPNAYKESQAVLMPNQRALWANSWIDRWLTWFFGLCLMLSGLGNFVVDCHIWSMSSNSVFANVAKKHSNVGIRRHHNWNDHAITFDKGGWCHVF